MCKCHHSLSGRFENRNQLVFPIQGFSFFSSLNYILLIVNLIIYDYYIIYMKTKFFLLGSSEFNMYFEICDVLSN